MIMTLRQQSLLCAGSLQAAGSSVNPTHKLRRHDKLAVAGRRLDIVELVLYLSEPVLLEQRDRLWASSAL